MRDLRGWFQEVQEYDLAELVAGQKIQACGVVVDMPTKRIFSVYRQHTASYKKLSALEVAGRSLIGDVSWWSRPFFNPLSAI